ncbi:MAG: molybdate ABC transporter permease subunit [Geminicoccaceae bacterium]|nr:molybdate ABC transporter permease subunit [Geminicoccaceae bacterium]MCX8101490.1 molybdate ABC transporter permease subunit [Geminicoccaceae bacterium]MDW8371062.1 molybdate ABC transporter permease subunit [Geminicoccaceae bacterium]
MDWQALRLSIELALATCLLLLPIGLLSGRALAVRAFALKGVVEAALALPLVLPPTVLGYYLLASFGAAAPLGRLWQELVGRPLVFTFDGLVLASLIANLPFAIQPVQRAFEAIDPDLRAAAACSGMGPLAAFLRIELPLAWPGVLTAMVLTFAHTLGEFGVVLMVGGAIPGETRTIAIAIYDRVQAFDDVGAARMSLVLLLFSLAAIAVTFLASRRVGRRLG